VPLLPFALFKFQQVSQLLLVLLPVKLLPVLSLVLLPLKLLQVLPLVFLPPQQLLFLPLLLIWLLLVTLVGPLSKCVILSLTFDAFITYPLKTHLQCLTTKTTAWISLLWVLSILHSSFYVATPTSPFL
jgi:hypothetical protein